MLAGLQVSALLCCPRGRCENINSDYILYHFHIPNRLMPLSQIHVAAPKDQCVQVNHARTEKQYTPATFVTLTTLRPAMPADLADPVLKT